MIPSFVGPSAYPPGGILAVPSRPGPPGLLVAERAAEVIRRVAGLTLLS